MQRKLKKISLHSAEAQDIGKRKGTSEGGKSKKQDFAGPEDSDRVARVLAPDAI